MLDYSPFAMSFQDGYGKGHGPKHPKPHPTHTPGHGDGWPCHPVPGGGRICHPDFHLHHLVAGKPVHIALWVFFALFAAGVVGTFLVARRVTNKIRVFHYLSALSLTVTTFTYFCLATGLGRSGPGHHVHHGPPPPHTPPHRHDPHPPIGIPETPAPIDVWVREVFWGQDAAHMITLPLFVIQFAILSGMAPLHALTAAIAAAFSGASTIAADHFTSHRRGFHPRKQFIAWTIMGLLFTLGAWFLLFFPGITAARTRRRSTQGLYTLGMLGLVVGWIAYPIVWFLGTGTNIIGVNVQVIVQGAIDVATQLGLVFFILFTHVHDPEDPVWSFPDWIVNARAGTGPDGRGAYSTVGAGDNADNTA
ncbi:family A G protein-coupled receptor-like protein [Cutaneotrichosporon oleaginosum]|uniref:Family A G protein-coupled receptor-like protein n=1 Tax=Cutaneotrichosporon oleaginosum TaxID=879819 RepID=A0A0J0XEG0_9TREE|nr:family A G protein-coupled receptor-like protein [Cutaneotrichosporon oleaginosum]KLT39456.1 family A G protein-coupled receptor-like protein [Cutaneotrichosporon oleaginosum]TXT09963.1 hypothetical protein COLE_03897 [Cutaneotrichosporon oleaginosum]